MNFPDMLRGSVWHTTTPERFKLILKHGAILPEPNISNNDRWKTARGPDYYPFVRSIGGVSLFDFRIFDKKFENEYREKYKLAYSSLSGFAPYCQTRGESAIWIEINIKILGENFLDGDTLISRWKELDKLWRTIMPKIETAYIGSLSANAFLRILHYESNTNEFTELSNF